MAQRLNSEGVMNRTWRTSTQAAIYTKIHDFLNMLSAWNILILEHSFFEDKITAIRQLINQRH